MKHYFVQIRYKGKYYSGTVSAETDSEALKLAEKKMKAGELRCKDEDFYNKSRTFITYEEIKDGISRDGIKEARTGVEVGNASAQTR